MAGRFVKQNRNTVVALYLPGGLVKQNLREDNMPSELEEATLEEQIEYMEGLIKVVNKIDDDQFLDVLPRLLLKFNDGVSGKHFEDEELNVDEYIGVKSYKARGKRLSVHDVNYYEFLEPFEVPEPPAEEEPEVVEETVENPEDSENSEAEDNPEISEDNKDGQLTLF